MTAQHDTLTPEELAAKLRVSGRTVRRQAREHGQVAGIEAIEVSPRRYVFSRVQVEARLGQAVAS